MVVPSGEPGCIGPEGGRPDDAAGSWGCWRCQRHPPAEDLCSGDERRSSGGCAGRWWLESGWWRPRGGRSGPESAMIGPAVPGRARRRRPRRRSGVREALAGPAPRLLGYSSVVSPTAADDGRRPPARRASHRRRWVARHPQPGGARPGRGIGQRHRPRRQPRRDRLPGLASAADNHDTINTYCQALVPGSHKAKESKNPKDPKQDEPSDGGQQGQGSPPTSTSSGGQGQAGPPGTSPSSNG